ncbi:MAG TPA: undecaprenyl-phosphate glucose phosphotransferase, partial [Xanthobacteraceae bacterium]|nr:undecaprenyl-phosphate glucose phosphotransferase [Xanthobacteraceae bacterium]
MKRSFEGAIWADRARAGASSAAARSKQNEPRELSALARMIAAEPVPRAISPVVLAGLVRLYEFFVIVGMGLAIHRTYVDLQAHEALSWRYFLAINGMAVATIFAFQLSGLYSPAILRTRIEQLGRSGAIWTMVFLVAAMVAFFVRPEGDFSRVWAASWFVSVLFLLYAGRLALSTLVRRWTRQGRLVRRTIIVGGGSAGENLIHALEAQNDS